MELEFVVKCFYTVWVHILIWQFYINNILTKWSLKKLISIDPLLVCIYWLS